MSSSLRFERDGRIVDVVIEKSSGSQNLDGLSRQAVLATNPLASLPADFRESTLTVHLDFEYQR